MTKIIALGNGQQIALDNIDINWPLELQTLFSRVRTADAVPQLYFTQTASLKDLFLTEGAVSGTPSASTYSENEASTLLKVGTTTGAYLQRTRGNPGYLPANSFLGFMTFNFEGNGQADVIKDVGFFDDNNGVFLRQKNGELSIIKRSKASGSVVDVEVFQNRVNSYWSENKFNADDGIGYDLDQSKCHIFWACWEWLGVGLIACGFVVKGKPVIAHIFNHTNAIALPWASYGAFPIAYRIERLVAGGTADQLRSICGAVLSEGYDDRQAVPITLRFGANTTPFASSSKTTGNNQANSWVPIFAFRLDPNKLNRRVSILDFDLIVTDNASAATEVLLVKNPTFSAAYTFTGDNEPSTAIQYQTHLTTTALSSTTVVTGWEQKILGKILAASANSYTLTKTNDKINNSLIMGSKADGTPDLYVLILCSNQNSVTISHCHIYLSQFV